MIRVTTLYAGSAGATAAYYTKDLTQADGEEPGVWVGGQAERFGISGSVVATEALELLLSGRDPTSGTTLGLPLKDRTLANGKVIRAVAGFDATVSAPKSLSVWWALTGDPRLLQAHDVAVRSVVETLERFGATTRVRSNGGRLHPETGGLAIGAFRQTTSRLDDPQLHTHLVISSKVQTADGSWLAPDARLLKKHQRALGGLYQSVLRAELTERFGVGFGEIVKGQAEITGVPAVLLARFSKRTAEIDASMTNKVAEFIDREGRDPNRFERAALGREAALDTRTHKTGHDAEHLRERWLDEAAAVGVTPETLVQSIVDAGRDRQPGVRVAVDEVIDVVSERQSAWHRMDLLRTLCDLQYPVDGAGGERWAQILDTAVDQILEQCVDLDPARPEGAVTRVADGRSVWIEPVAAHVTSQAVLVQEEHVLSWAIDQQLDDPTPSTTVIGSDLDLLQGDAAASVAGDDGLVLIVGPAGTGKTTMLRAAVTDLHARHRPVFGVAPTAKAAQVLETETGMVADTVAKLLYEWSQPDRTPGYPWDIGPGTTLIVDEAGMLGTHDLDTLTRIADAHDWRLVLVGDPRQLQGVARGGLFNELCMTGRTVALETVHRFTHDWEAAASLQIRNGDPRGFDAYQAHGRIIPGTLAEHLERTADTWIHNHAAGKTVAVTTTTNAHVEAINELIQHHRLDRGDLNPARFAQIAGGAVAYEGDVVATRRNNRQLHTTSGDTIRNRDTWTITNTDTTGDVTVSRIDGHGTVTLPADYVREHVRLAYAATEPGNQSGTETMSITLATSATTGRGIYVSMTRGQEENQILVVTKAHDMREARDVLEMILVSDRVDIPATTVRRQLAKQDRQPPTPALQPRCQIPEWWAQLRRLAVDDYWELEPQFRDLERRRTQRQQAIAVAEERLDRADAAIRPFDAKLSVTNNALARAESAERSAKERLADAGWLGRKQARVDLATATETVNEVRANLAQIAAEREPFQQTASAAYKELRRLQDNVAERVIDGWTAIPERFANARQRIEALDAWKDWAAGKPVTAEQTLDLMDALQPARKDVNGEFHQSLANVVETWADARGIHRQQPFVEIESHSFGIEL